MPVVLPQPARPASAPEAGPRPLTPAQTRDGSTVPGDLRPQDPVVPQIRIPLGKGAPPPSRAGSGPAGGLNDSVAQCESRGSKAARSACLRGLRQPPPRKP